VLSKVVCIVSHRSLQFVNIEKYVDIRGAKFVQVEHLYLLIHNYKHGDIRGEEEGIIYEKVFP